MVPIAADKHRHHAVYNARLFISLRDQNLPASTDCHGSTVDDRPSSPACNRTDTRSAAILTGSAARWAQRAVVCTCVWPSSLPIIGNPCPEATAIDAKVWRRSWIRTSFNPARARTRRQTRFASEHLHLRVRQLSESCIEKLQNAISRRRELFVEIMLIVRW
jgi:hypothetical protein